MAKTGYVKPVDADFRRLDQGVDYQGKPGTFVKAIGLARVDAVKSDPGGFGNVVYYTLLDGPMRGQQIYVGHAEPVVVAGRIIQAGDPVAMLTAHSGGNAANLPGWTEIGFAKNGVPASGSAADLSSAKSFQKFVNGLGAGPASGNTTSGSAGSAAMQPAPAAPDTSTLNGTFDTTAQQPAGPSDPTLTQPLTFAPGSGDVSGVPQSLWRQILSQSYVNPDTTAYAQNVQTAAGS